MLLIFLYSHKVLLHNYKSTFLLLNHYGVKLERKGIKIDVGDHNRAIKAYNEQVLTYQALQQQARQAELERAKTIQKAQTHENAQKGTLQSDKPKSATLYQPHRQKAYKAKIRRFLNVLNSHQQRLTNVTHF